MKILVTGAKGFIGSQITAALVARGHEVVVGTRNREDAEGIVRCDFSQDVHVEDWLSRLQGLDVVINCVGILREHGNNTFHRVHVETPSALFRACEKLGLRRVIQISALGSDRDGVFIQSKHRGDEDLTTLDLDWIIIRPSVVYTPRGSYGGTSLLRAMAALPWVIFFPGSGQQQLQPICAEDLANAVTNLIEEGSVTRTIIEAVSPEPISMQKFLLTLRDWLGFGRPIKIYVPMGWVKPVAWLGEKLGNGPLGMSMYNMLQNGNVGSSGAYQTFCEATHIRPRSVDEVLTHSTSYVQDRWHARLYFLGPVLRVTLALLWIASGLVGLTLPMDQTSLLLGQAGVAITWVAPMVYGSSIMDIFLGCWLLSAKAVPLVSGLMLATLVAYTVFLGLFLPSTWLEPFGGLIKNIPLIPAVLVMVVLSQKR